MIAGNRKEMSNSGSHEMLPDFLRDILLLSQNEGLENSGRLGTCLPCKELPDSVPPTLHLDQNGMFEPLADFDPSSLDGQKSDGVNSLEGKITFVVKTAGIVKPAGRKKFTQKAYSIAELKRNIFLFQKEKDLTLSRNLSIGQNDFLRMDQQVCSPGGPLRGSIDDPFYCNSIETHEGRKTLGRRRGVEVCLD